MPRQKKGKVSIGWGRTFPQTYRAFKIDGGVHRSKVRAAWGDTAGAITVSSQVLEIAFSAFLRRWD